MMTTSTFYRAVLSLKYAGVHLQFFFAPPPGGGLVYSQFRVIRGCHVEGVRVQIRFIHLLENEFLLILLY